MTHLSYLWSENSLGILVGMDLVGLFRQEQLYNYYKIARLYQPWSLLEEKKKWKQLIIF